MKNIAFGIVALLLASLFIAVPAGASSTTVSYVIEKGLPSSTVWDYVYNGTLTPTSSSHLSFPGGINTSNFIPVAPQGYELAYTPVAYNGVLYVNFTSSNTSSGPQTGPALVPYTIIGLLVFGLLAGASVIYRRKR